MTNKIQKNCPYCGKTIQKLTIHDLQLKCPECDEPLVDLEKIFAPEQLDSFMNIVNRAREEPEFFQKLVLNPLGTLNEAGIEATLAEDLIKQIYDAWLSVPAPKTLV
jgi:endogenous inhibitor of DNA gyrase (YacG/DUF329 family)